MSGTRMSFVLAILVPACTTDASEAPAVDSLPTSVDAAAATSCPQYRPLKNAYFGDLHTHTSYSYDAYTFSTRTTPIDAYAFAKSKGLDFAAVTDHSELLAIDFGCAADPAGHPYDPASPVYDVDPCPKTRSTDP